MASSDGLEEQSSWFFSLLPLLSRPWLFSHFWRCWADMTDSTKPGQAEKPQECWALGCDEAPVRQVEGRANNPVWVCQNHAQELVDHWECEYVE